MNTSKAELPCGFKRFQLPCYKSWQHLTSLLWAEAAKYPHLRDREQGLLSTPVWGDSERQTG